MFDNISNETARACLEALTQLHREGDKDAILSFVNALDDAKNSPMGEVMLSGLAQIGKASPK